MERAVPRRAADHRARDARRWPRAFNDAERELQARNWLVLDLMEQGDIAAVRAGIEAHERLAAQLRLPAYTWWGPMWRSTLAILEGRFADAEQLIAELAGAREPERQAVRGDPDLRRWSGIAGASTRSTRRRSSASAAGPRSTPTAPASRGCSRTRAEPDEARAQIDWVAADDFARLGDDMNRLAALAELAQAMQVLADPTHAAGVHERLAPYADRNIANGRGAAGYGSAAHHLAVLEALLGARRRGRASRRRCARNAALGSRPWLERTQAAYEAFRRVSC